MKKVLLIVRHFEPDVSYGGPSVSMKTLLNVKIDGVVLHVVTSLYYYKSSEKMPVSSNRWLKVGEGRLKYVSNKFLLWRHLFGDYSKIYINGLFSFTDSIIPLILSLLFTTKDIVIAPRSEFNENCLSHSKRKKLFYLSLVKPLFFTYRKRIKWHATELREKEDIQAYWSFTRDSILVASNIPRTISLSETVYSVRRNHIVYASRITPKKNLQKTIDILSHLKDTCLTIYGEIDDLEYWSICKKLIDQRDLEDRVFYNPAVQFDVLKKELITFEFAILLTDYENYGHSLAEFFELGIPVVTTENSPWAEIYKRVGNLVVDTNEESYVIATQIKSWLNSLDHKALRMRCGEEASALRLQNSNLDVYHQLFSL